MKIADLMILKNISSSDLQKILQDPEGKIIVGFSDIHGKQIELDIAPLFRDKDHMSEVLKQTFDFADYYLHRQDIMFMITAEGNEFSLNASRLTGINNSSEEVLSHSVRVHVTTSTGNPTGELTQTRDFIINIANEIQMEVKDSLMELGVTITGDTWSGFKLQGKALIEFTKFYDNTVFVGNRIEGFIIN